MVLSGWITSWDAKQAHLSAEVAIFSIPEPGTTALLGVGLGILCLPRRQGSALRLRDEGQAETGEGAHAGQDPQGAI